MTRSARLGAALMTASAADWAFGTIVSKAVLDHSATDALPLLVVQLTASVAALAAVAAVRRQSLRPAWRDGWTGLFEPGLAYVLGLAGLASTSAANATVLGSLEPVIVPLLVWVLWRQRPGRARLVLTLLATAGAIGVSWAGGHHGRSLAGDALVVAGVSAAAVYAVVSVRSVTRHPVATLAAVQQTWALAAVGGVALVATLLGKADWPAGAVDLLAAGASGVLNYALPFGFYLAALKHLPVSSASSYLSLIPVFGVAGSVALLGEPVTIAQVVGAAVVVVALLALGHRDGVPSEEVVPSEQVVPAARRRLSAEDECADARCV